jgi:hypothetical protein
MHTIETRICFSDASKTCNRIRGEVDGGDGAKNFQSPPKH